MEEMEQRRRGRRVFLTWFVGLFGTGTLLMAFLLLATGEVGWTSPVIIGLLVVSAAGVVCLVYAVASLLLHRGAGRGQAAT